MSELFRNIYRRIDKPKIRHQTIEHVKIDKVLNFNKFIQKKKQLRAGIIPYTIFNGKVYFGFGIDTRTSELTDFGGGVQKQDKTPINTAIREFREESLGIFDPLWLDDLNGQYLIYSKKMLIIFLYCGMIDTHITRFKFNFKLSNLLHKQSEVKGIIWLDSNELLECIKYDKYRIYSRVKNFLKNPILKDNLFNTLVQ